MSKFSQNKNFLIVKGNELVEAKRRQPLTLREKKMLAYMVSCINPYDDDFKDYKIALTEFVEFFKISDKNAYTEYFKIASGLMSKQIIFKGRDGTEHMVNWVSRVSRNKAKKELSFSFEPTLKSSFLQLKSYFTSYRMINLVHFVNCHSETMYELLKQYESIGRRRIELVDLREYLGLQKKYGLYANLKVKVLDPAIKEINEFSDITVDCEEMKEGRKVVALQFSVHKNPDNPYIKEMLKEYYQIDDVQVDAQGNTHLSKLTKVPKEIPEEYRPVVQRLVEEFFIDKDDATVMAFNFSRKRIDGNLDLTLKRQKQKLAEGKGIENISNYAYKAITSDYAKIEGGKDEPAKATKGITKKPSAANLVIETSTVPELEQQRTQEYLNKLYHSWFDLRTEEVLDRDFEPLFDDFRNWVSDQPEFNMFFKVESPKDIKKKNVRSLARTFVIDRQNLRRRFSLERFMEEHSYHIEEEGGTQVLFRFNKKLEIN